MTRLRLDRVSLPLTVLGLALAQLACTDDAPTTTMSDSGTETGDGDGDPQTGDGDGDGDPETGDGDGDGDGDSGDGDGDGDGDSGDGDGDGDSEAVCGDSMVEGDEECDVGSETAFCDADCTFTVCGDGYQNMQAEQCDDGNEANTDGCVGACVINVCGDGILYEGMETCDDGNLVDTDECKLDCSLAVCGDGVIWDEMETCEDMNMVDTDECTNACQQASCGDGVLWEGMETCDDGNLANDDMCPGSCAPAFCGDGYTLANDEECDDGNDVGDDFCTTDCSSNAFYDDFESNTLQTLPWASNGDAQWATNSIQPHEGMYSAANGDIFDDQTTNLEVTLTAPADGVVTFWYRVSSEEEWDYLQFYIDDVLQDEWSGDLPWAQASYPVTTGQHTFRWTYYKDSSLDDFEDTAWIDEVYLGLPQ